MIIGNFFELSRFNKTMQKIGTSFLNFWHTNQLRIDLQVQKVPTDVISKTIVLKVNYLYLASSFEKAVLDV